MSDDIPENENNDEHEDRPDFNSVLHADEDGSPSSPRGISRSSAVLLFLLASAFGGAIGWLGPSLLGGKTEMVSAERFDALSARLSGQETAVSALQDAQTKQAARLRLVTNAQKEMGAAIAAIPQNLGVDIEATNTDTTEVVPSQDIADITQRLAKLEAGQALAQTGDPLNIPDTSALTDRLAIIDTLQETTAALSQDTKALDMRVGALEDSVERVNTELKNQAETAALTTQNPQARAALIASFPLRALEDAAAAQTAKPKKGFIAQSLGRHVKVIDSQDPLLTIKAAQDKLAAGDITGAVATLDTLDPAISGAAQDWIRKARSLDTQ